MWKMDELLLRNKKIDGKSVVAGNYAFFVVILNIFFLMCVGGVQIT